MTYLNQPIKAGSFSLGNRIVLPPMATGRCSPDGTIEESLIDYYKKETESVGLVILEHCYINPAGRAHKGQVSIADDSNRKGFESVAGIIHSRGAKALVQLSHAGSATSEEITGSVVTGPSPVLNPVPHAVLNVKPREMTPDEIRKVIQEFTEAAERAVAYGFDGVEIHCAHGYLLNQFYSPLTNHRTDQYGGEKLEDRIRITLEIVENVRELIGARPLISIRLGGYDYMDGGTTLEDSARAGKMIEEAGADLLDISGGLCGPNNPKKDKTEGYFKEISKAVKEYVNIPVMLTGGITKWQTAELLLQEKYADLIGVGRTMLKDPFWAQKALKDLKYDLKYI